MDSVTFPKDFVWGCATASYQIEGAAFEGGKGESIWDRFSSIPGNVRDGATGLVACDHYHRFREDVALMKKMGLKAYRFSISWPRIMPKGIGELSEQGLAFYGALLDELHAAGIEPYVTLYHWDLPQALQDLGGWVNPAIAGYFLEYCKVVMNRFGGKVRQWITLNEPFCVSHLGYAAGVFAPGVRDVSASLKASYNLYVAHGLVVKFFREAGLPGRIGIALNLMGRRPATDSQADADATLRSDGQLNRWFLAPLFRGNYPQDMMDWYRKKGVALPEMKPEELRLMSQPLDFLGINYYNLSYIRHEPGNWPLEAVEKNPAHIPTNDREWPVTEEGLTEMLLRLSTEYGAKHILITENGASFHDLVTLEGRVEDGARKEYLRRHLLATRRAMDAGAPVEGYLLWSFCDNFEWADGYGCRFGIVHVDFDTLQRTVKDSGLWYSRVIQANAIVE